MVEPARIQTEDFSVDQEMAALRAGFRRMGGIATFIGCARDFSEGREVTQISFDAYGSMALVEMNKLRDEAIENSVCWMRASCTASAWSARASRSCSSRRAPNTARLRCRLATG